MSVPCICLFVASDLRNSGTAHRYAMSGDHMSHIVARIRCPPFPSHPLFLGGYHLSFLLPYPCYHLQPYRPAHWRAGAIATMKEEKVLRKNKKRQPLIHGWRYGSSLSDYSIIIDRLLHAHAARLCARTGVSIATISRLSREHTSHTWRPANRLNQDACSIGLGQTSASDLAIIASTSRRFRLIVCRSHR